MSRRINSLVRGPAAIAVVLVLTVIGVAHLIYHQSYTLDDAYISFRYARNLVRGAGFVFNPGEYVKGYSNTLFSLLMAVPESFRVSPLWFAKLIGLASFGVLCWLLHQLHEDGDEDATERAAALWSLALVAVCAPLAIQYVNGLETGLYTTLILAAVVARLREQTRSGKPWSLLLFCAISLSRPEGILVFGAMAVHDALYRVSIRRFPRIELLWYAVPPAIYVGELAFSRAYYGNALPQTYYAKVHVAHSVGESVSAIIDGLATQLGSGSVLEGGLDTTGFGLLALPVAFVALADRDHIRRYSALWLVLASQLVFVALAGNAFAPGYRFVVPALPLVIVLLSGAIAVIARLAGKYSDVLGWALAGAWLLVALPVNVAVSREVEATKYVDAAPFLVEGYGLAQLAPPGSTLSSFDIGGYGYAAAGFDVMDAGGLATRETARCRNHELARCERYAELVAPDVIRRHPTHTKDQFVANGATRAEPYLELQGGSYLIKRSVVLVPQLPEWTTAPELVGAFGSQVVGHDLGTAFRAGARIRATFYWKRDEDTDPGSLSTRRLEWWSAKGHESVHASEVLWRRGADIHAWTSDLLFADYVTFDTPKHAGRYELHAISGNREVQALATIDVVAPSAAAPKARALAARAKALLQSGNELAAIRVLERAQELGREPDLSESYTNAVIARAKRLRSEAERGEANDRMQALRIVEQATALLHRAYYEIGRASSALRAELDATGAYRAKLVAAELAVRPSKHKHGKKRHEEG